MHQGGQLLRRVRPLVTQILKAELARRGVAVNNHLCEHFAYSRQELFHLVRVGELRTFEEILAQTWPRSRAAISASPRSRRSSLPAGTSSCWHATRRRCRTRTTISSPTSRRTAPTRSSRASPAGEITPQQLITIGADRAEISASIPRSPGGQRIDLLGAQVHQLPLIWRELVEAGFESGHAYGKAVRTVKSCVGSTWCRYGVQDSVGLALEIENRYKGLRSPHKIKFAVSGCTRECAEAQSKDVGVIATEKGWNLYVCGNGGMKPRHAELLASDLDRGTLIRYIDRFLMFYIRTADRLQRTSVWRDNLEGGLDYLKQVVCEDRLGIAAELESRHAIASIDTYECEWRRPSNDPQTLRRFRHFINSDRPTRTSSS